MPTIPQPKLPHLSLPAIGNLPSLPHIGCAGGDANSYLGKQFGNLPDLQTVLHLKAAKKFVEEQIYALFKGQLPDLTRPPVYAARQAQLAGELADMVAELNDAITRVVSEATAALDFVNGKINQLNSAKNDFLAVPEQSRSALQRAALEEFDACVGELNQQVTRLQSSITCVQQIG